ncbi:5'-nucleotidase C-terminal domain-containing protein [Hymenobacter lapidiphilus]|uniref:5'-nucleotidase C-terminal domain-containing protein n=1 Tax=Hymenobacter lapidiphilus TaxID=2608003 RepID=A0A7Y7PLA0_9BACT|nr:5'-nucleotidase C-terminal domain-containing protein [Hymenobacter lapidiphilus]NVO29918.1 5'-nucleotidase C-terminal domain-containing protein [Hymenobacter lapidiphilus]
MRTFRSSVAALSLLAAVALAPACQRAVYQPQARLVPVTAQPVGKSIPEDARAMATIAPYREKVVSQMTTVLGNAPVALTKQSGESLLSNFVGDLQRVEAEKALGRPIPLGVVTNGGLRAPIPAGPVTVGTVFELMPFENQLVVLDAPGAVVQQLFDFAARTKMAVSGATFTITPEGKPEAILIGGQPFDATRNYAIAISDYLAGGGDAMAFFKPLKPEGTGVLLRNAIMNYIKQQTAQGKPVQATIEGRIKR